MEKIDDILKTRWLGQHYTYLEEVDSTSYLLYKKAEEKAPMGTVIAARSQLAGRGRRGRVWVSKPGDGLWFSLLLRPPLSPQRALALTLVTAVGVCRGLSHYSGLNPGIKWPNDILVGGRKLCGILAEMKTEGQKVHYAVIGIGMNIRTDALPSALKSLSIGLEEALGRELDSRKLLCHLLTALEDVYELFFAGSLSALIEEWQENSLLTKEKVRVKTGNEEILGTVLGLSEEGFLCLETVDGKKVEIISGDVSLASN